MSSRKPWKTGCEISTPQEYEPNSGGRVVLGWALRSCLTAE
ncbi:hypothetical protein [Desulfovibrio sp.]|nr:hypothetical protein [Desulfovibrio sp.]